MAAIELIGLTKVYPGGRGIFALDLAVEEGEVFGFIGPNGAGKSTTIRTLLGLLRPTGGAAKLLGRDIATGGAALRAAVGYAPSEPGVWEQARVADALSYLASFHAGDCAPRRRQLCEALDLDPARRADDLSLGNKKKVALVAALQHAPAVVVLDEPTSGLDPLVQQRLFELLRAERARGATVFFSSHVLAEVQRACERVAVLREGRLVEVARVEDMRASRTKRVRLRYGTSGGAGATLALPGVSDASRDARTASFTYAGDVGPLLAALAADAVADVQIEEPSLEEIVMRHYGDEVARA